MHTDLTYLDVTGIMKLADLKDKALLVELVGMDIVIELLIIITVLLAIITFYTMRRNITP